AASAAKPQAAAAKPTTKPHPAPAVAAKSAAHETSAASGLLQGLLGNPLLAPAGLLLGLLLAGWAVLRRRRAGGGDGRASVFDSRIGGGDSFFGASGGERVDTHNSTLGSSIQYSPSQVDSLDVDPVAEADVYLAYGRDLQAEEILKEALKNHPDRNAARVKLLEIYAKRKDARSFELMAAELFTRTDGAGDDWKKAQELGRDLDAANPLYHNTQPPSLGSAPTTMTGPDFDSSQPLSVDPGPTVPPTELLAGLPSLSGFDESSAAGPLDLDLPLDLAGGAAAAEAPAPAPVPQDMSLDFDLSGLSAPAAHADEPPTQPPAEPAPLEFDLGNLGLQAPGQPPATAAAPHEPAELPALELPAEGLDTRLALVEECRAMGDLETARNLLHEILAESDGATRAQAEKLLAELGGGS
ncbi:MAG: fimbrial protein FimV, partial [Betaproteobacteria bacterium]|nr:fimbrial protein FimV [Betaproteobacteria bacterium]